MNIIILTQYYPPETGAPQNRLHSLALNLKNNGHKVEVLTAMPNYPKMKVYDGYRNKLFATEQIDGIKIFRSWIFVIKSKAVISRLLNYFSFVFTCLIASLKASSCEYVVCESPPLFLGISAIIIAKFKRAKLIFNVSDLWPESAEKLGIINDGVLLQLSYRLEKWIYKNSFLISGQTQGIVKNINARFPSIKTHWLPNGIDEDVYKNIKPHLTWRNNYNLEGKKIFLYAGIIGHAQGLEVIIKAAAQINDLNIVFVLVGDGPVKAELILLNKKQNAAVVFIPNTPKKELMEMVADAYAYIVPLKKLDIFKGAIPSKLFDPLALGRPIILGVEGEAKELFINKGQAGIFYEPENTDDLVKAVLNLHKNENLCNTLGANGKEYINRFFNREKIANTFIKKIQSLNDGL